MPLSFSLLALGVLITFLVLGVEGQNWEFRLVGGKTELQGRVEARPSPSDPWGTLCVDPLFKQNSYAPVAICNSAGFVGVTQATRVETYGQGSASQPIYLTNVHCTVNDTFIANCSVSTDVGQCSHGDDVGINCDPPPPLWQFRLANGTAPSNGILQMRPMPALPWGSVKQTYIYSEWSVRDHYTKQRLLCEEVGFPLNETADGRAGVYEALQLYYKLIYFPTIPSYYFPWYCAAENTNIRQCLYYVIGADTWSYTDHLWLDCRPPQGSVEPLMEARIDEFWLSYGWKAGMGGVAVRRNSTQPWVGLPTVAIFDSKDMTPFTTQVSTPKQMLAMKLICEAAGYPNPIPAAAYYPPRNYYVGGSVAWISDNITCPLDATAFGQCYIQPDHRTGDTRNGIQLSIDCYYEEERPREWEFRLVGGPTTTSGLVQMRPNATAPWSVISGINGDMSLAPDGWLAACRSIGFTNMSNTDYANLRPYALRKLPCAFGCTNIQTKWLNLVAGCGKPPNLQHTVGLENCTNRWRLGSFTFLGGDALAIDCAALPYDPTKWEFRFVQSTRAGNGKVEFRPWPQMEWGIIGNQYITSLNSLDQLYRALSICRSLGYLNVTNPDFISIGTANLSQEVYAYGLNCNLQQTYAQNCSLPYYILRTPGVGYAGSYIGLDCYSSNVFKAQFVLEAGGAPTRGRILYKFNSYAPFGTVCNDYFRHNHFSWNAVCHSVGYTDVTGARYLPMPGGTGNVYLDDVKCLATDFYLENCKMNPIGQTDCFHGQDAGVDCYPPPDELWHWQFRITQGSSTSNGRLEMRPTAVSSWGTVCSDVFNHTYAAWMAACRSVGFPNVQKAAWRYGGIGPELIYLDKIDCRNHTSNTANLTQCKGYPIGSYDCTQWDTAGVDCDPQPERPHEWEFALRGGTSDSNGRVMMRANPSVAWGTVCKRGLTDIVTLLMICKSLGFSATTRPVLRNLGRGSSHMYLDEGSCAPDASSLNNCTFAPLYSHDCLASDGALALDCYPTLTESPSQTQSSSLSSSMVAPVSMSLNSTPSMPPIETTSQTSTESPTDSLSESDLQSPTQSLGESSTSSESRTPGSTFSRSAANSATSTIDSTPSALISSTQNDTNRTRTKMPTVTETITLKSPVPPPTKTILRTPTASYARPVSLASTKSESLFASMSQSREGPNTDSLALSNSFSQSQVRISDTHVRVSDTHVRISDTHVRISDTPVRISDTHVRVSDTHVRISDTHVRVSDTHVRISDTPVRISDTHVRVSDTHVHISDTPVRISDTHVRISDSHVRISDTHVRISDTHVRISDTHVRISDTHVRISDTHVLISKTEEPRATEPQMVLSSSIELAVSQSIQTSAPVTSPNPQRNVTQTAGEPQKVHTSTLSANTALERKTKSTFISRTLEVQQPVLTDSKFASGASRAIGIVSSLFFLVGDGSAIEVQAVAAMMLAAPCASEWDRDTMLVLRYFLSPFIDLGSIAVILLHVGITTLFMAVHFGIVCVLRRVKQSTGLLEDWRVASAYCMFPAVPMLVWGLLYTGAAFATMEALVSDENAQIVVASVIGLPFLIAVPALTWLVVRMSKAIYFEADLTPYRPSIRRLMPKGMWGPPAERRLALFAHGWVRAAWLRPACIVIPYGVGLLSSILVVAIKDCMVRYALMCLLAGGCCIGLAGVRPHRSPIASILSSIAFGALCVLCGAQVWAQQDGEGNSIHSLRLAAMAVLLVATLFRTFHGALVLWLFSEPKFLLARPADEAGEDDIAVKYEESQFDTVCDSNMNSAAVSRAESYQPKKHDRWVEEDSPLEGEDNNHINNNSDADSPRKVVHELDRPMEVVEDVSERQGSQGEVPVTALPKIPMPAGTEEGEEGNAASDTPSRDSVRQAALSSDTYSDLEKEMY